MITRENIGSIIEGLTDADKSIIANTDKGYIKIELVIFNTGSVTTITPVNDLDDLGDVSSVGDCILFTDDPIFSGIHDSYGQ